MIGFTAPPSDMIEHRKGRTEQHLRDAHRVLGVPPGAGREAIKASFHAMVRSMHTDAGGTGGDIAALKEARDILLEAINGNDKRPELQPCPLCEGRGSLAVGFASEPCGTCGGKGTI